MPSPQGWLSTLEHRLHHRWNEWQVFDAYYEGDHRLAYATTKFREAFGSLFQAISDNWMPIVVDSSVERLEVQGFRFGQQQEADDAAWDIWQTSNLDSHSDQVHTEAVKLGEAYWLVEPPKGNDPPRITAEHPSQVIVATAPGGHERLAALKKWTEDGFTYANVYLPNAVYKYRRRTKAELSVLLPAGPMQRDNEWSQIDRLSNPIGVVPVIPVPNNPSMLHGGRSDLDGGAIDIQNAINKLLSDMLIGSEYQSYPQRVLLGVEPPRDQVTGQPLRSAELKASQSHLWYFNDPNVKVEQFAAAELKNFIEGMQHLTRHLTAQTRTPPHYVLGEIVNASGDALKAAETGLVSKVRRKMKPFGEAHEDVMRLAFKALGDEERADETSAEVIWRDPESRSQAETVDASVKLSSIGVPNEVLWERVGFSPQEIDRMRGMQETEALLAEALQPTPQPEPSANGSVPLPVASG